MKPPARVRRVVGRGAHEGYARARRVAVRLPEEQNRPGVQSRAVARALTEAEESTAAQLQRAGLPRATARCLVAVLRGGWWTSGEAVGATGLTQPDVSAGMRDLVARGAAEVEKVPREGKGRPALRHRAAPDALKRALASRREELTRALAVLDEVEARVAGAP